MRDDNFLTHQEFIIKFNLYIDVLQYNSITSAIKNYQSKSTTPNNSKKPDFQPHFEIIIKCNSGISNIRNYITSEKNVITGLQKWQNTLNISKEHWLQSFHILRMTTTDTKLRWFQIRVLHHILTTNRSVSKFMTNQSDLCEFCGSHSETIQHLLWHCVKVKMFWKDLSTILQKRCSHIRNIQLNEILILFGNNTKESLDYTFLLIILLAKFFIYRNKVQKTNLNARLFLKEVYNRYKVEMYICKNSEQFQKAWAPYQLLFKALL